MECWEIYASPGRVQERSWKKKPEKEYMKLKIYFTMTVMILESFALFVLMEA